jgi:hypothetical protein
VVTASPKPREDFVRAVENGAPRPEPMMEAAVVG